MLVELCSVVLHAGTTKIITQYVHCCPTWIVMEERKHEGSQIANVGSTAVDRVASTRQG